MAGILESIVNRLGYHKSPSAIKAVENVKQLTTPVMAIPDPDAPATPANWDIEIGDPGTDTWAELYQAVPFALDPTDIKVYSEMRYGNGTCQAMMKVLQLPILATKGNLVPGTADKDGKVAAFVNSVLFDADYDGGMEIPMQQVWYEVTSAFWAGYKPHEIVWKRDPQTRKIGIRKIAPRSPMTTKPVVDKHGNLIGAFQQSEYMSQHSVVFIPREKLFWYSHRMEDGNWYGESDFRAAHLHYEVLRKLYIIDNKTHEVTAIPIRVAQPTMGGMTDTTKKEVFNKIKRVGLDTAILLPKDFELREFGAKNAAGATRQDSINHHTTQMAMSVLAHFLQLGTNGQGTYNLSSDQSDFFLSMITAEMRSMARAFTSQVIAPLVKVNFGVKPGLTPRYEFAEMTDHVRNTVESIFLAIVQGGGERLSDEYIEALGKRVASELGLDLTTNQRNDSSVPKATVGREELDKIAMEKFKAQAAASGAAKAGPGRGNTEGGANQDAAKLRKQGEKGQPNKGSSKGNLSAGELADLSTRSDNTKDFFGRLKLVIANKQGVSAPATPAEVTTYLNMASLSSESDIDAMLTMATDLVYSSIKEGEDV
jgi:hypothetical protein